MFDALQSGDFSEVFASIDAIGADGLLVLPNNRYFRGCDATIFNFDFPLGNFTWSGPDGVGATFSVSYGFSNIRQVGHSEKKGRGWYTADVLIKELNDSPIVLFKLSATQANPIRCKTGAGSFWLWDEGP